MTSPPTDVRRWRRPHKAAVLRAAAAACFIFFRWTVAADGGGSVNALSRYACDSDGSRGNRVVFNNSNNNNNILMYNTYEIQTLPTDFLGQTTTVMIIFYFFMRIAAGNATTGRESFRIIVLLVRCFSNTL